MASDASTARDIVEPIHGEHRLAGNALGLSGVLFCIVTGAAPIAAMLFNVPVATFGGGTAVPAAFILATIVLTIFSVGYIEMARRVSAAGGFYSFISHGFGQVVGLGAASTVALCYIIFSASVTGVTSYFANTTIHDWFGVSVPVWLISLVTISAMTIFAWFHIELTAKVLGVCLVAEVAALAIFAFAVLVQGGENGLHASSLSPTTLFDGDANGAKAAFGSVAVGVALFGAFWSWIGFEMAPNYAEESRNPKAIMAPATYISVVGLGIVYTFVSWMFVAGWGGKPAVNAIALQYGLVDGQTLPHNYGSAFYPLTDKFVGHWLTLAFELLIVTGSFACQLAFYNTASRYLFSMGRERIIPATFGRTHPSHHSPYLAAMLTTGLVLCVFGGFTWYDHTTLGSLLKLGTWGPLMGVFGILCVMTLCSAAIVRYFLVHRRDEFHIIRTLIAPVLGFLGCAYAAYLLHDNREFLAGGKALWVDYLAVAVLIFFLIGAGLALFYRSRNPERYAAIGEFHRRPRVERPKRLRPGRGFSRLLCQSRCDEEHRR